MAVSSYIPLAMLLTFAIGSSVATFEEMIQIPQQGYDSNPTDPELESYLKRFPEHTYEATWFWFNLGECPKSVDGTRKFYCATLTKDGNTACIDDHQLCNGVKECPHAEDENPKYCLFYKIIKANLQGLERDVQTLIHRSMRGPARRYSPHGITHTQYK